MTGTVMEATALSSMKDDVGTRASGRAPFASADPVSFARLMTEARGRSAISSAHQMPDMARVGPSRAQDESSAHPDGDRVRGAARSGGPAAAGRTRDNGTLDKSAATGRAEDHASIDARKAKSPVRDDGKENVTPKDGVEVIVTEDGAPAGKQKVPGSVPAKGSGATGIGKREPPASAKPDSSGTDKPEPSGIALSGSATSSVVPVLIAEVAVPTGNTTDAAPANAVKAVKQDRTAAAITLQTAIVRNTTARGEDTVLDGAADGNANKGAAKKVGAAASGNVRQAEARQRQPAGTDAARQQAAEGPVNGAKARALDALAAKFTASATGRRGRSDGRTASAAGGNGSAQQTGAQAKTLASEATDARIDQTARNDKADTGPRSADPVDGAPQPKAFQSHPRQPPPAQQLQPQQSQTADARTSQARTQQPQLQPAPAGRAQAAHHHGNAAHPTGQAPVVLADRPATDTSRVSVDATGQSLGNGVHAAGAASGTGATTTNTASQTAAAAHSSGRAGPLQAVVTEHVAVRISRAAMQHSDHIDIQLKPASLGRVDVSLNVRHDGHVHAIITADKPDTLHMLKQDARGLQRALHDAGLKTDSGSLSFNLRGGDRHPGGNSAAYSPAAYRAASDSRAPAVADVAPAVAAARSRLAASGVLDIHV